MSSEAAGVASMSLAGVGELVHRIYDNGIVDLVCLWGDMGDALEALGDLLECAQVGM